MNAHQADETAKGFGSDARRASLEERNVQRYMSTEEEEQQQSSRGKERAGGQVKKSTGRMPWHWEPKKDVTSCDKLR